MTERERAALLKAGKLQVLPPDTRREPQFVGLGEGAREQVSVSVEDGRISAVPGAFRHVPLSRNG